VIVAEHWMPLDDAEIDAMMDDLVRNFGRNATGDGGR
jgi:hypothetical protein